MGRLNARIYALLGRRRLDRASDIGGQYWLELEPPFAPLVLLIGGAGLTLLSVLSTVRWLRSGRAWNSLKNQIVIAAIRSQSGFCYGCGVTKSTAELTVRPLTQIADGTLCGFAPWNLATICYTCADEESDEAI